MNNKKIIIAIDGYSGCGKSSTAKLLAKELDFKYLDSGAMYRAVTLFMIQNFVDYNNLVDVKNSLEKIKLDFKKSTKSKSYHIYLNGIDVENKIRSKEVSELVSKISLISMVRKKLVNIQRLIGKNKGIVMEGRDIATVVFPNADFKFFLIADILVRAERRLKDLEKIGEESTLNDLISDIEKRDVSDSSRDVSPLVQAKDAIAINTSNLTINEQVEKIVQIINN